MSALRTRVAPALEQLRGSDTAKAAWLAGAMIANNVIALISTVVFARLLSDYGSLAALVSYFLILGVVGQAMQVATAREGVLGHLGVGPGLADTLRRWTRTIVVITLVSTVVSILLRQPIADAVGVSHNPWAAAVGLPAGVLWLEISILRGALQGVGDYRAVGLSLIGEQTIRLISGAILAATGLGVTGAYLGTPISFLVISVLCVRELRRHVTAEAAGIAVAGASPGSALAHSFEGGVAADAPVEAYLPLGRLSLGHHVRMAWAPIAGLIVLAMLQNIDIIAAKHRFAGIHNLASSYAATAVAAKVLIWVAIGAGFYLVPEVARNQEKGHDTRPVLARALGIILVCAVPVLLIFAFAAHPLLQAAFGTNRLRAVSSLLPLGIAFTLLAATYLAIQYMLALKRFWFLIGLAAVAIAEPIVLLSASRKPASFATVVLAVQGAGAVIAFTIALARDRHAPADPELGPLATGEVREGEPAAAI